MNMVEGLEGKTYGEQLSSAQSRGGWGEASWCAAPHREQRNSTELCSLVTVTEPEGTEWSWDRGESDWVLGEDYSPRGLGTEQSPQGSDHGSEPDKVHDALRHQIWVLCCCEQSQDSSWTQWSELSSDLEAAQKTLWILTQFMWIGNMLQLI